MTTGPARSVATRVLFVGHDGSSPQIAASLLRHAAGDRVVVDTASTQLHDPGGRSDEMLVAMGLNPAGRQRLNARSLHTADRVVVLGRGLDVARLPGPRYEEWDLVHDDLNERVRRFSSHLEALETTRHRPRMLSRLRSHLAPFSNR